MSILEDEHQIQHDLFKDMLQRGWYQVEQADTNKVNQAKQKFQNVL
jgi:spore coat protein CotF